MILFTIIVGFLMENIIIYKYSFSLLDELRYSKKLSVFLFILILILNDIKSIAIMENILIKFLSSELILFIASHIVFKDKLIKKVTVQLTYAICVIFSEILSMTFAKYVYGCDLSNIFDNSLAVYMWQVTTYIFIFISTTVVHLLVKNKKINMETRAVQYIYLYIAVQCLFIVMFCMTVFQYKITSGLMIFTIFFVMCISVVLGIMLYKTAKVSERKAIEAEFIKRESEIKDKHFYELKEQYVEFRKLRHDFYNHIKIIDSLDDSEKIKEYTNEIKQKFDKLEQVSFCNNLTLDALLSLKRTEAKQHKINISIAVCELSGISVSDYDLCTLVSNLMDNAITASAATSDKQISIKISRKMERLIISVKNSSMPVDRELKTTKADSRNHGIGLGIIKKLAEKYDGDSVFRYDDGEFLSVVTLCCSK